MKVTVCIGSSCHLKGSRQIMEGLQDLIDDNRLKDKVELCGVFCMKNCVSGVSVSIEDNIYSVLPDTLNNFFENEILKRF